MTRIPDIHRRRVNWSLDLETCRIVQTYAQEHDCEDRFAADFLIRRGADAVGHRLSPEDYRAIADEVEHNKVVREELLAENRANRRRKKQGGIQ